MELPEDELWITDVVVSDDGVTWLTCAADADEVVVGTVVETVVGSGTGVAVT